MKTKVKPWAHQVEAISRASRLNNFGFFFEVGAGKTLTACHAFQEKMNNEGRPLRTIIFGPPIVVENWRRELLMHTDLVESQIVKLEGPGEKRRKLFKEHSVEPKVFITNYESLNRVKDLFDMFVAWKPEVLIWDELHKLKDFSAQRTKLACKLAKVSKYRFGLTGTPILNSYMDLFTQFYALDLGGTFGHNYFSFRGQYFYDANSSRNRGNFPDWRFRKGMEEELVQKINRISMSVKKDDCLDLPPLIRKSVLVGMTAEQRRVYEKMRKDFIAFIQDKVVVSELAVTKALRLQQIVSGFVSTEEHGVHRFDENPRKEALKELLEELTPTHKVIVWAVFKENYKVIEEVCDELKIKAVAVHGEIGPRERVANVDAFNTDPSVRVFYGHPLSAGIGINLVASDVSIFYSRNFSLEQDIQAEARNYRGGSEVHKSVVRIDLVCPDSIDEQVVEALKNKVAISEKVLREMV